jgi:hypothetical protein
MTVDHAAALQSLLGAEALAADRSAPISPPPSSGR